MKLYTLGSAKQPQTECTKPFEALRCHVSSVRGSAVKVLWASWCDSVIATRDSIGSWTLAYAGTGLAPSQASHITASEHLRITVNECHVEAQFFGSVMHDGLRGYTISGTKNEEDINHIVIFATDVEIEAGVPALQQYSIVSEYDIDGIEILSAGEVLLHTKFRASGAKQITHVPNLAELRNFLEPTSLSSLIGSSHADMHPARWCSNATTGTVLDEEGRVYTSTCDPRYPKCLGRPYGSGRNTLELVPYLSESKIAQISSGGYLTAAVSSDGELYLWGQNCPGAKGKLSVLEDSYDVSDDTSVGLTSINVQGEQDDFVRCLEVLIDGQEARVYDVAVGHGHILVAAEVVKSDSLVHRVVLAAGDNEAGQLGLDLERDYMNNFREVVMLRGERVEQLMAAGWTSFVVTVDE